MTKIEIIKPLPEIKVPRPRVQCSVVVDDPPGVPGWRRRHYASDRTSTDHTRCQFQSVVKIDGKVYCARHAGNVALRILLEHAKVDNAEQS